MKLLIIFGILLISLKVKAEIDDVERFIIRPISEESQEYGYKKFCKYKKNLKSSDCNIFRSKSGYKKLNGMKGEILKEKPIKKSKYIYYPVQLENGEKYYIEVYKPKKNDPFESRDILNIKKYNQTQSIIGEPVISGSALKVISIDYTSGEVLLLSNGKKYEFDELIKITSILNHYKERENDEVIFNLLHEKSITEDRFENSMKIKTKPYVFKELNYRPTLSISLEINQEKLKNTLTLQYSGNDWLFVNSYKILAGDYIYESDKVEFSRNNRSGKIWEWQTIPVDSNLETLLHKIISDSKSTIRFYGKDYYKDVEITELEKKELYTYLKLNKILTKKHL